MHKLQQMLGQIICHVRYNESKKLNQIKNGKLLKLSSTFSINLNKEKRITF